MAWKKREVALPRADLGCMGDLSLKETVLKSHEDSVAEHIFLPRILDFSPDRRSRRYSGRSQPNLQRVKVHLLGLKCES